MNTAKQILQNLIEEMPENEAIEVIDFIGYLKSKREKEQLKDLQNSSESSIEFWNNKKDDEEWNDI